MMEKETSLKEIKQLVSEITGKRDVSNLVFIGCGASYSELFAAYYYVKQNALGFKTDLIQANEFNYAAPAYVGEHSVAVVASLGGTTKESIEAVSNAKKSGAYVLALTYKPDSALSTKADFTLQHKFFESYATKASKQKVLLTFAVELLHSIEKTENYDQMVHGLSVIDEIANKAADGADEDAEKFAMAYRNEDHIFTLASGANEGVAYSTGNFIFMEMQWIKGTVLDSAELFHGPFELAVKDAPYLLFMSDGKTRHLDSRALEFLQRFDTKYTVIDAKDYWLDSQIDGAVVDYFDPMVLTAVMRKFAERLGDARNHPLSKRRYMWKLENY
ncbi:SIS domain-containing protein [uncultured Secundilactobacillus sp.]|uniref:SIS domain-containing protein n=1 Tax=uncultured Secundilactobacillus sp. TaxID=2813935 RepID=UPI00258B32C8|nr:SIS domain-containing protein [uncultured Secundilactobacillus sp.]